MGGEGSGKIKKDSLNYWKVKDKPRIDLTSIFKRPYNAPKVYKEDRECPCGTILSIYNGSKYCNTCLEKRRGWTQYDE